MDLLKYDPDMRLTCRQCLEHPYIAETTPGNIPPGPQVPLQITTNFSSSMLKPSASTPSMNSVSPRTVPPSHSHSPANVKPVFNGNVVGPSHGTPHRRPFFPQNVDGKGSVRSQVPVSDVLEGLRLQGDGSVSSHQSAAPSSVFPAGGDRIANGWTDESADTHQEISDAMDVSPVSPPRVATELGLPMDVAPGPGSEDASKMASIQDQTSAPQTNTHNRLKLFGKNRKGVLGMFGLGDKGNQSGLPPVDELNVASSSMQPLRRATTSSTGSQSLPDLSPPEEENVTAEPVVLDAKSRKREAQRVALEAEKARRALLEKRSREQARAVMQKRNQMNKIRQGDFEWDSTSASNLLGVHKPKSKSRSSAAQASSSTATINAAGGRFRSATDVGSPPDADHMHELEYRTKARRREFDDDHSMSSSDLPSASRLSLMSFATAESDPVQSRLRQRPNLFGIARMQSSTSLRTSFGDDFSARSSDSPSFELPDHDSRTSMSSYEVARSSMSEASSPLPMQALSLSSPQQHQAQTLGRHSYITLPPLPSVPHPHLRAATPSSPYEYGQFGQIQAQPPSPAIAPHSAINPIFKVVSCK